MEEGFREIYDLNLGILDFRKVHPTDIKNNPRVKLCKSRPPREEAELETRQSIFEEETKSFLREVEGADNLTPGEKRGLVKLQKRVKAGEIIVYPTDKSGK